MSRQFDLVVYGATGFTGSLVVEYLAKAAPAGLKWAIAGRSEAKLKKVRETASGLNPACSDLPMVIADTSSVKTLREMAASTKVVLTTVGPYSLYGEPLVKACIDNGAHYCDLTGEVNFIAHCIRTYHKAAQDANVKIVHCCGFDSIPSDIGAFMVAQHAKKKYSVDMASIDMVVLKAKGGVSGGTIASAAESIIRTDKKDAKDSYCLLPPDAKRGPAVGPQQLGPRKQKDLKRWTMPFVMESVNARIVRRSAAMLGYGPNMLYRESQQAPNLIVACIASAIMICFIVMFAMAPTRWLLRKFLPAPSQGPSRQTMKTGAWVVRHIGTTEKDASGKSRRIDCVISQQLDPGYMGTAVLIAEAALTLAVEETPGTFGVIQPAVAMGEALATRLSKAGLSLQVQDKE